MNTMIKISLILTLNVFFVGLGNMRAQAKRDDTRTHVQYLSGTDNENTVSWGFFCTGGRNSGHWGEIEVPSHWEQQGYGNYNYGRDYVTYGKNFRFYEEQGIYRHSFDIDNSWKNKRIFIVFEGSMTDTEVKVNGQLAGPVHQGAFYRFKYEVTDKVQWDKTNQLEVKVSKISSDPSVNNAERLADYWIFGGIFRPVYLEAMPETFMDWTSIDARADGTFAMHVHIDGAKEEMRVETEVIDEQGKSIAKWHTASVDDDSILVVEGKVKSPKLWNAEAPHLYTAKVRLLRNGKPVHSLEEKFGFRTIEIRKQEGIYVNGTKVKMKGVNRHVWWPKTGRAVNAGIDLQDVQLIKEMNMNAVRCSHYPPDKSFLRICDSLGLYVLDELAGWQKAYQTSVGKKLVREMVIRDANHPSIIFWSNGNEGGHNFELDAEFARYDLSARPVIHAHHRPGNAFNGIDCNHYEDFYSTQNILADTNIYMTTEFLHSQDDGGGAAALEDIWELHWQAKLGAGGFLWALVDEGIVRTDEGGKIDVNGVNAPDGLVGPYREREGSVSAIREIFSPIKIAMKSLPESFEGKVAVENRYHFTNLAQCDFRWQLVDFAHPLSDSTGSSVKREGRITSPDVAPLAHGTLKLDLPDDWKSYDALTVSASDPQGNEVYRWYWKIRNNSVINAELFHETVEEQVSLLEDSLDYVLKANGITVRINKVTGLLSRLGNDFSMPLSFSNGPTLVSGQSVFEDIKIYDEGVAKVIEVNYTGDLAFVKWRMYPTGWLEMEYQYALQGDYSFAGVTFNYPENYVLGAKWLGKGPYRVWKNRMQGGAYGVWSNRNNATQTGAFPWLYPEFKGYYADVTWMEMNTVEGKFYIAGQDEGLFVRLFDFYGLSGPRPHPELPKGDISFLDYIPPIGTKLALRISSNTSALGPLSELNYLDGTPVHRKIWFYFGSPKPQGTPNFVMPKENILTD